MKHLKTEIEIQASPQQVWEVLTDFESYPEWNPMIRSIKGELKMRNRLKVVIHAPKSKPMTIRPKVTSFKKHVRFSWMGHMFIIGLFDGQHIFEIKDLEDGVCKLIHREEFSGILVPLMSKFLDTKVKQGFEDMNKALRDRIEEKVRSSSAGM